MTATTVITPPRCLSPVRESRGYRAALLGKIPAEALSTGAREDLVAQLCAAEWTDVQIAVHTRMSTYTTARIRERIGMAANRDEWRAAA